MEEYIKREDAINLMWLFADESCASVVSDFESLPAADVAEVRHGRWETAPYNGVYDMRCSACGFAPGIRFYSSDYCPNCGARMGKEDEHEAG